MSKKKAITTDFMDLDEARRISNDMLADNIYKSDRARSPKSKRACDTNIKFWGSISYYLGLVASMTDDEFIELENRAKQRNDTNED